MNTSQENAVHDWVVKGSGFPPHKVVWSDQDGIGLDLPYITLEETDLLTLGSTDQTRTEFDPDAVAGEEITTTVEGPREFGVVVLAVTSKVTGDDSARSVLARVQTALSLPSVADAMDVVGVSCFDRGRVLHTKSIEGTGITSRARLEPRFYRVEGASEKTTYIEEVQGTAIIEVEITETSVEQPFTLP